ncbi:DUF6232 family protein [Vibrio coralliilyticus]|uniref:DUF6232 family protein n=1 Tax=Vibrio coralliilyticus TaxID=190893 RepID=UPI001560100C|nr:DUF6232 family protein [Vibrio coralliilyticus]NRF28316.1 hypothetical protein [Vibrio coralliilyticus]NRF51873.1 hypothetical protein [Vibrio coralliilyticus]NRG04728.1 hypothetical protein [Vibrio coralliilyticus]
MSKITHSNKLVGLFRFRRTVSEQDFMLTSNELVVKSDAYKLSKIKRFEVRRLGIKENIVRVLSLALVLSAATWAFVPQVGLYTLALTLVMAFVTWRKYELRAEFKGTDETGDHWVSIVRGCDKQEYQVLKQVEEKLQAAI